MEGEEVIETHAVRSTGGAYVVSSQRGSVSGRSRASSTLVLPNPPPIDEPATPERSASLTDLDTLVEQSDGVPPKPSFVAGQPRRRRHVPLAGFSKVLQDATRVAEALGKAQKARKEREQRTLELIKDQEEAEAEEAVTGGQPLEEEHEEEPEAEEPQLVEAIGEECLVDPAHFTIIDNVGDELDLQMPQAGGGAAPPTPGPPALSTPGAVVTQDAFEYVDDEVPFVSSEDITAMCEERVRALHCEDQPKASSIAQKLFIRGIAFDDSQGRWTAADGRIGHYDPPRAALSPRLSPGASPSKRTEVPPIDDTTYQRLLGRRSSPAVQLHSLQTEATRRSVEGLPGRCPSSQPGISPPAFHSRPREQAWQEAMLARSPSRSKSPVAGLCGRGAVSPSSVRVVDTEEFAELSEASPNNYDSTLSIDDEEVNLVTRFTPGERLYFKGAAREQMKQKMLQHEREMKVMEELASISKTPVITRKAAAIKGDFHARQEEWAQKVRQQKEDARLSKERQQEREGKDQRRVHLSKKTEDLVRRPGGPKGPVGDWESRFAKHCRSKVPVAPDISTFKPKITTAAAKMGNRGNTAERLHNDAVHRVARHEARVLEQVEKDMYDPATGKLRYTPSGNATSQQSKTSLPPSPPGQVRGTILFTKAPRTDSATERERGHRQETVVHRLLSQGQAAERKKAKKKSEITAEEQTGHPPQMSKATHEILSRIERRPLHETSSREQRGGVKHGSVLFTKGGGASTSSYAESDARTVCSMRSGVSGEEFAQRSLMKEKQRQQRLERMRQNKENAELQDCTFTPAICSTSKMIFKKCTDRERSEELWGDGGSLEEECTEASAEGYTGYTAFTHYADEMHDEGLSPDDFQPGAHVPAFDEYTPPVDRHPPHADDFSSNSNVEGVALSEEFADEDEEALLNKQTYYTYPSPAVDAGDFQQQPSRSSTAMSIAYAQSAQSAVQNWRRLSQHIAEESD